MGCWVSACHWGVTTLPPAETFMSSNESIPKKMVILKKTTETTKKQKIKNKK
jgi:hypothetical protein